MRRILLGWCVLALAGAACQALGGNPIPNPTRASQQVLFYDDFSDPKSGWPSETDAEKSAGYSANEQYTIKALGTRQDVWSRPGKDFADASVEVDARKSGGPDRNGFGVLCRLQDKGNFYFFLVSSDGYQVIGKYQNGRSQYLSAPRMQPTHAINAGSTPNHIRGECNGPTLTLYANGQQLAAVQDTSFVSGDVGLIVSTFDEPDVEISFDNFVVYQP
ncbi:MAG: hypothetical protein ACM3QS_06680 [Bacteroidota bacterium]